MPSADDSCPATHTEGRRRMTTRVGGTTYASTARRILTPGDAAAVIFPAAPFWRPGFDPTAVGEYVSLVVKELERRDKTISQLTEELSRVKEALRRWQTENARHPNSTPPSRYQR